MNIEKLKRLFENNKKTIFILTIIILVGIFLRTYNFHDWLRFSHDQARDAWLISKALGGKNLPLLGPNAGTTAYQLGPAYYYFSYVSEKLFGNYPDKMAYPSLFFSILSIPLFFFFMKEFFDKKLSLSLTAIMSVSYFLVINSRFSSNPNLITFFVLLYLFSLLKILNNPERKNKYIWSILAGVGIGVSIQLHTSLLTAIPITTFFVFAYIFFKNKSFKAWKILCTILAIVIIINASHLYHEIKTGGGNTELFFKGLEKTSGDNNYGKNIFLISACQMQANTHIISSLGDDNRCSVIFQSPSGKNIDNLMYYFEMTIMVLFSAIGYFLLGKRFLKNKNQEKKNFLGLILFFNAISFILFIPIAKIIYVGYFINLFFVPFVILGILIEEIKNRYKTIGKIVIIASIFLIISSSLIRDAAKARSYYNGLENNSENSTLGEVELMSQYVISNSKDYNKIYFSGQEEILGRFYYPIEYFIRESGKKIEKISAKSIDSAEIKQELPIFYIEENGLGKIESGQTRIGLEIVSSKEFARQTILILKH